MNATTTLNEMKQAVIARTLQSCRLFSGLPEADIDRIAGITVVKPLNKGEYLFHEAEPSQGFYIVQKGAVNVHRVSNNGKEQIIHIFRTGESFAEATLATETGYPADARAVESTQVLLVQKRNFIELLKRQPELGLRMLASMSLHLRVLVGRVDDLTLKDVETRLANWLLKRCPLPRKETPFKLELNMTKRVLAAEIGTASETFSRTLGKFRDQKLLSVNGRTITIHNPVRLQETFEKLLTGSGI